MTYIRVTAVGSSRFTSYWTDQPDEINVTSRFSKQKFCSETPRPPHWSPRFKKVFKVHRNSPESSKGSGKGLLTQLAREPSAKQAPISVHTTSQTQEKSRRSSGRNRVQISSIKSDETMNGNLSSNRPSK